MATPATCFTRSPSAPLGDLTSHRPERPATDGIGALILCVFLECPRGVTATPLLPRSYAASALLWPCPTPRRARPACRGRWGCDLHPPGPAFLHSGLPSLRCRAHYPGGPIRRPCRLLPGSCGLPRFSGGPASAISLSRPAQAYCTLRSAGLLAQLSLGFVTRLPPGQLPDQAARQLPCLPTTTRVGSFLPQGVRAEKAH